MFVEDILNILRSNSKQIAYTVDNKEYTYSTLYKYVCNLYNFIIKNNKENLPIIVYGHKEVYMKALIIACILSNNTYIPIDESTPISRVELIKNEVKTKLNFGLDISKEEIKNIMENEKFEDNIVLDINLENTSYIIFTSGSTGIPKGVMVSYSNLNTCINWLKNIIKIKNSSIVNLANFSFDLSVADFYLSLVTNSNHYIVGKNKLDFENTFKNLKSSNAELIVATPSYLELLLLEKSFNSKLMPNLKIILFCGEKLSKKTVNKLFSRFDNIRIINSYGPTETTFAVTSKEYTNSLDNEEEISVGTSKSGVNIYIVDEDLNIKKDLEVGEILITGDSVSKGYTNPDKNKNTFIKFNNVNGYLTGDLGYIKNDELYCIGRKDRQIKYKGYRIELTEIESVMESFIGIEKVVVLTKLNKENNVKAIYSFVKLSNTNNSIITKEDILKEITLKLPEYMIPKIKIVKEFSLNQNGKIDTKKLLEEV